MLGALLGVGVATASDVGGLAPMVDAGALSLDGVFEPFEQQPVEPS